MIDFDGDFGLEGGEGINWWEALSLEELSIMHGEKI